MRAADEIIRRMKVLYRVDKDADLAEKLGGTARNTISNWRSRDSVPFHVSRKVAEDHDVSIDWLITGRGEQSHAAEVARYTRKSKSHHAIKEHAESDYEMDLVRPPMLIVAQSTGGPVLAKSHGSYGFDTALLQAAGIQPEMAALLQVVGDPMERVLFHGDIALIDQSDTSPMSGRTYGLRMGAELLVRYIQQLPGGGIEISCENSHRYRPFTIDADDLDSGRAQILGRVRSHSHDWD